MSIDVMNLVWNSTLEGPARRHVLVVLADRGDEFGVCHPGMAWIARRTGISKRQVIRIVAGLEADDYLTVDNTRVTSAGDQDTNLYLINIEKLRAEQQPPVDHDAERAAKLARLAEAKERKRRSAGGDTTTPPADQAESDTGPRGGDTTTPPPVTTSPPSCPGVTTGGDTTSPNPAVDPAVDPELPPNPPRAGGGPLDAEPPPAPDPTPAPCPDHGPSCRARACGTSPRARQRALDADQNATRRACGMCNPDGHRWDADHRPVVPHVTCDHRTPHAVAVADAVAALAAREAAEESARVAAAAARDAEAHRRAATVSPARAAARATFANRRSRQNARYESSDDDGHVDEARRVV